MFDFRNELAQIKEKKMQERDALSNAERILKDGIIPYLEMVGIEELSTGVTFTVYLCDKDLLVVAKTKDVVYQKSFSSPIETSEDFEALREKLQSEGCKIFSVSAYSYYFVIKA